MFLVGQHDRPDAHGPLDELKALSSPLRVTEERAEQPAVAGIDHSYGERPMI